MGAQELDGGLDALAHGERRGLAPHRRAEDDDVVGLLRGGGKRFADDGDLDDRDRDDDDGKDDEHDPPQHPGGVAERQNERAGEGAGVPEEPSARVEQDERGGDDEQDDGRHLGFSMRTRLGVRVCTHPGAGRGAFEVVGTLPRDVVIQVGHAAPPP